MGFNKAKKKKIFKYWQPTGTAPRAYFSPIIKWAKILDDPTIKIYITEGEKKAACGCKNGIPTIGLGGVWSWKAKKMDIPMIEDLDNIIWNLRTVYLAFDSDIHTNTQVMFALITLGYELRERGAVVFIISISSDKKMGMDDFIVKHGIKKFKQLPCKPLSEDKELHELNNEIALIELVDSVYKLSTGRFIQARTLTDVTYADKFIFRTDRTGIKVKANAAKEWLEWPGKRKHKMLNYIPGQEQVLEDSTLNTWSGWGVASIRGDITPWAELIEYIFGSAPEYKKWFLQWVAYPLQNPGVKMNTAILFIGPQGVGKSFIGYILGDIYGKNFNCVGRHEIYSQFNDWAVSRQFIMGDEITGSDKRHESDILKAMLTREKIVVHQKYQPRYEMKDCINYLFTSNHIDAVFLENSDRRFFVHETPDEPMKDKVYERIEKWRYSGGTSHLFHYLLNRVDTKTFNPESQAPLTGARTELVYLSRGDLDMFCHQLFKNPDDTLRIDGKRISRDLFTVSELILLYDPDKDKRTTLIAMSKALKRAGFKQKTIRVKKGIQRIYVLRNREYWWLHWDKVDLWIAHYDKRLVLVGKK